MHDPYTTRFWMKGKLYTEVHHEDALGHCVPLLDAATGKPVSFERKPAALTRALRMMNKMDAIYGPGEYECD